jgi:hypothetical protein
MFLVPKTLYAEITFTVFFNLWFKDDDVHLAPVANNIFLNTLQGSIEHFISGLGIVYPPQY